jgi:predicted transcriptional regulator of viral defense system
MATYREQAWEIAVGRHGYVTTREAVQRGIPGIELVKMAARGKIRHLAHGIYRFDELPTSDLAPYYEAVLRVGDDSFLLGDAVLALHGLANVNPKRIRVASKKRVRRNLPEWIRLESATVTPREVEVFESIRTTTVTRALLDARPYVMQERLLEATSEAYDRGLIAKRDVMRLEYELLEPVE